MITAILSDFSRVILNPKDKKYQGTLNGLNKKLLEKDKNYSFFDYFEFNEEILSLYRQLRLRYSANIFTSGTIHNRPEVRRIVAPIFENIYTAKDFGINKKQPDAYLFIAEKLNKKPSDILFIDDQIDNIQAAHKAGLNTIQYSKFEGLVSELKNHLNS